MTVIVGAVRGFATRPFAGAQRFVGFAEELLRHETALSIVANASPAPSQSGSLKLVRPSAGVERG